MESNARRVVITGMGVVAPNGHNVREFWRSLTEGRSGVRRFTAFDSAEYPCRIAGEVVDFDPLPFFREPKTVKRADRFMQFAAAAARMAIDDSGLDLERIDPERVGVSIGTGIGGLESMERAARRLVDHGPTRVSPFAITGMMGNAAGALVSQELGLNGPSICIVTACATGGNSIGEAARMIRSGETDAFLAGGCEATITPLGIAGFVAMKALSLRNDDPAAASRPFDRDRDGFVMGEGAGVLVLEESESARRRGATIYCELAGYGCTADAHHMTHPQPEGRQVARAMTLALRQARLDPSDLDYINAHATSTPVGDACEALGIQRALGTHHRDVAVSSTKSMTGHLLGGAGAIETVACALAIREGIVPPTINLENPDCDLDHVALSARETRVRTALNNSFGFGGHNTALLLRELRD